MIRQATSASKEPLAVFPETFFQADRKNDAEPGRLPNRRGVGRHRLLLRRGQLAGKVLKMQAIEDDMKAGDRTSTGDFGGKQ